MERGIYPIAKSTMTEPFL